MMFNQDIFDAQFLRFSADEIQRSIYSERWVGRAPLPLILMVPCESGRQFLKDMPPNPALFKAVINDFLTPDGEAYSVVSMIFNGILAYISDHWHVSINLGNSRPFSFRLPLRADVGLVPSPLAKIEDIPVYIERYVRTHRHSLVDFELLPA